MCVQITSEVSFYSDMKPIFHSDVLVEISQLVYVYFTSSPRNPYRPSGKITCPVNSFWRRLTDSKWSLAQCCQLCHELGNTSPCTYNQYRGVWTRYLILTATCYTRYIIVIVIISFLLVGRSSHCLSLYLFCSFSHLFVEM